MYDTLIERPLTQSQRRCMQRGTTTSARIVPNEVGVRLHLPRNLYGRGAWMWGSDDIYIESWGASLRSGVPLAIRALTPILLILTTTQEMTVRKPWIANRNKSTMPADIPAPLPCQVLAYIRLSTFYQHLSGLLTSLLTPKASQHQQHNQQQIHPCWWSAQNSQHFVPNQSSPASFLFVGLRKAILFWIGKFSDTYNLI